MTATSWAEFLEEQATLWLEGATEDVPQAEKDSRIKQAQECRREAELVRLAVKEKRIALLAAATEHWISLELL